jgi:hypothetical protein
LAILCLVLQAAKCLQLVVVVAHAAHDVACHLPVLRRSPQFHGRLKDAARTERIQARLYTPAGGHRAGGQRAEGRGTDPRYQPKKASKKEKKGGGRVGGNLSKPLRTKKLRPRQQMAALPGILREREEQRLSVIGSGVVSAHGDGEGLGQGVGDDDASTQGTTATNHSQQGDSQHGRDFQGPSDALPQASAPSAAVRGSTYPHAHRQSVESAMAMRRASAASRQVFGGHHGGDGGSLPPAPVAVLDTPYYTRQQAVPRQSCVTS